MWCLKFIHIAQIRIPWRRLFLWFMPKWVNTLRSAFLVFQYRVWLWCCMMNHISWGSERLSVLSAKCSGIRIPDPTVILLIDGILSWPGSVEHLALWDLLAFCHRRFQDPNLYGVYPSPTLSSLKYVITTTKNYQIHEVFGMEFTHFTSSCSVWRDWWRHWFILCQSNGCVEFGLNRSILRSQLRRTWSTLTTTTGLSKYSTTGSSWLVRVAILWSSSLELPLIAGDPTLSGLAQGRNICGWSSRVWLSHCLNLTNNLPNRRQNWRFIFLLNNNTMKHEWHF